jgi:hypothetical protein
VAAEGRGHADQHGSGLTEAAEVGGSLEPALCARGSNRCVAKVLERAFAVIEGTHLRLVDVEAEDPKACPSRREHERQADIT